jgi:hypothetical protein
MVLKAAHPLNSSERSLEQFVMAFEQVMEVVHSSKCLWQDAPPTGCPHGKI